MKKKYDTLPIEANEAILNIITPMGLEFKRNSMYAGENIGKLYGIIKYPPEVNIGWLSKINNMPGTIVCQTFTPTDNSELIQNISSTIRQKTGEAESARDPLVRQRAMKAVEQGENIMKQIDQNGETALYSGRRNLKIIIAAYRVGFVEGIAERTAEGLALIHCNTAVLVDINS